MTLYLAKKVFKIKVLLKLVQKDIEKVLDPLYNQDKIFDWPIMNANIYKEENAYINYSERHIIQVTKDWIKKPFKLDLIP